MIDPVTRLAAAEANATAARERLSATVTELQQRLNPRRLAREAVSDMADAGSLAADSAGRNPGALAGAVAIAGLFLARHRVAHLFGRPRAQSHARPANLPEN
jgi:hypothetical protein